ncbi:MAG: ParB/RepB/Spo0J family partition protein [Acidobacteria bacterium]|nr:ParB/RepB/Spo0J family partition protein [Acidobacteriota bacterium]
MEPVQSVNKMVGPKRGLGRGLEALLPPAPHLSKESIRQIEMTQIVPNPYQPRQSFHAERLKELSESIKTHGIIQPIVVKQSEDYYILIAGERRWRAAQMAGMATIPAIIKEVSENQVLELTLIENIQREDLNPIETAEAFARLTREAGLTHEQVAERTGKDRATITNLLRLLKLPQEVQKKVANGELSMGHARALLSLATETAQKALAMRIVTQGLSVRQTEKLVKDGPGKSDKPLTIKKLWNQVLQDPNVLAAVEAMERRLGTKVRLMGDDLHGKIVIEYYTSQDLDRIYELIVGKRQ